jgi:hypothetical protein
VPDPAERVAVKVTEPPTRIGFAEDTRVAVGIALTSTVVVSPLLKNEPVTPP